MDPSRVEPDPDRVLRMTESVINQISASKPRIRTVLDLIPFVSEGLEKAFGSINGSTFYGRVVESFDNIFRVAHDTIREHLPQPAHAPWLRILNLVPDRDGDGNTIGSQSLVPILNVDLGTEELRVMIISWSDNRPPQSVEKALNVVSAYAVITLSIQSRSKSLYAYVLFSSSKVIVARYDQAGKCTEHHIVDISQSDGRRTLAKMLIPPLVYNDTRVPILSSSNTGSSSSSSFTSDRSRIVLTCRRICETVPSLGIRAPIDYERRVLSSKLVYSIPEKDEGPRRTAGQKSQGFTASELLSPFQKRINAFAERRFLRPDKIMILESWDTSEELKTKKEFYKTLYGKSPVPA